MSSRPGVARAPSRVEPSAAGDPLALGLPDVDASRAHLRDLAALLALPRMWRGHEPAFVARSLLDVLVSLLRLDAACVRLWSEQSPDVLEDCRPTRAAEAMAVVRDWTEVTDGGVREVASPQGAGVWRLLRLTPQLDTERAIVVVASTRAGFPTDLESFLCRIAVEQSLLAVHASRLVANLRIANATKATFLATMSHELRTPLNAIVGYADLLQAEIDGALSPTQRQHVHRIEGASRHLIELIEGILTFARIEAGREQVHLSEVGVADVLDEVGALVAPLAAAKGLSLTIGVVDPELRMCTDAAKVRQILLNLLSNAVKFTHAGRVDLEVRCESDDVLWVVSDTGIGIAAEDLPLIFEPFRQVGEVHTKRAPGTGLGLSVSRQLAALLGGDVVGESTPGEGSRFTLRLPRDSSPAGAP